MCCIIVFIETFSFRDDFIFGQIYFITLESVSSFISLKTPQLFYTIMKKAWSRNRQRQAHTHAKRLLPDPLPRRTGPGLVFCLQPSTELKSVSIRQIDVEYRQSQRAVFRRLLRFFKLVI